MNPNLLNGELVGHVVNRIEQDLAPAHCWIQNRVQNKHHISSYKIENTIGMCICWKQVIAKKYILKVSLYFGAWRDGSEILSTDLPEAQSSIPSTHKATYNSLYCPFPVLGIQHPLLYYLGIRHSTPANTYAHKIK